MVWYGYFLELPNNEQQYRQSAAVATMQPQQTKNHSHIFRSHSACGSQIEGNNNLNSGKLRSNEGLFKNIENQIRTVTEKPACFLWLQGLTPDWSKLKEHPEIFSVFMGFLVWV